MAGQDTSKVASEIPRPKISFATGCKQAKNPLDFASLMVQNLQDAVLTKKHAIKLIQGEVLDEHY